MLSGKEKISNNKLKELVNEIRIQTKTFELLVPTNLLEERRKFIKSKNHNPQFTYPPFDKVLFLNALDKLKKAKIKPGNKFENYIWKRRIRETKLKLKLFLSIGQAEKVTKISQQLYQCKFNNGYIEKAKRHAKIKKKLTKYEERDAKQTAKIIKNYLKKYDAQNWRVKVHKNADYYIQIRYKKELISINSEINWDFNSLDSTLAHEIDGHVVRALNALRQTKERLQNPFPFYIKTEEGLASYLGDYYADNGSISRKHHAIKYLAGFVSLNNSFREVYNFLLDHGFSEELAFQRTLRLKRGFTNTVQPGVFAREAIYYEGMLDVKDYIDKGKSVEKLYAGKIGLKDIPYIKPPMKEIIPDRIKGA